MTTYMRNATDKGEYQRRSVVAYTADFPVVTTILLFDRRSNRQSPLAGHTGQRGNLWLHILSQRQHKSSMWNHSLL